MSLCGGLLCFLRFDVSLCNRLPMLSWLVSGYGLVKFFGGPMYVCLVMFCWCVVSSEVICILWVFPLFNMSF